MDDLQNAVKSAIVDFGGSTEAEAALRESEERYRTLVEAMSDGVDVKDASLRYVMANSEHLRRMGLTKEQVIGKRAEDIYDPEFAAEITARDRRVLETGETDEREGPPAGTNSAGFVHVLKVPLRASDGSIIGVVTVSRDISAIKQAEAALRESEERYRTLAEAADDAIMIIGLEGTIEYANSAAVERAGISKKHLVGGTIDDLLPHELSRELRRRLARVLQTGTAHRFELKLNLRGRDFWMHVSLAPIRNKAGGISALLAVARDVTELVEMREELRALSLVDDLTGLHNRRGFSLLAGQQLRLAERNGKRVSLMMVDLDGLKAINDAYGHREGDAALAATARILKDTCRESDVVGRLGGDEFAVLVLGTMLPGTGTLAGRIEEAVSRWNQENPHSYSLSLSIGVATLDGGQHETLDDLISRADVSMYERKRRRKRP